MKLSDRRIVATKKLQFTPYNPKGRTEEKSLRLLLNSIQNIGLLHPITITKNNVVIDGNWRLACAKLLGWNEIECNVVEGDADTIYSSVNSCSKVMTSREALGVWLHTPTAVPQSMSKLFQAMQYILGRDLVKRIYDAGMTYYLFREALKIARYCGQVDSETVKAIVEWGIKYNQVRQVSRSIVAGYSPKPKTILNAVMVNKPVKFVIAEA